jgi:hypothetical protein
MRRDGKQVFAWDDEQADTHPRRNRQQIEETNLIT